eukprot:scaffold7173_cov81-Skeletonema_dohrnii-CCMP3373.AAC.2
MLVNSCWCSLVRCLTRVVLESKPRGLSADGCCVQFGKGHASPCLRGSGPTCREVGLTKDRGDDHLGV